MRLREGIVVSELPFNETGQEAVEDVEEDVAEEGGVNGAPAPGEAVDNVSGAAFGGDGEAAGALEHGRRNAGERVGLKGGGDVAGADGGGGDARAAEFHAEAVGEGEQGGLGGGVEVEPGQGDHGGDGGDIDDGAVALGAEVRQGEAGEVDGGVEVEFVEVLPGGLRQERRGGIGAGAGVIDENVDAAEVGEGGGESGFTLGGKGEVHRKPAGVGESVKLSLAGEQGEAGAGRVELVGQGGADAGGGAGDEDAGTG